MATVADDGRRAGPRATVHGRPFADDAVFSDAAEALVAVVGMILRNVADDGVRVNSASGADVGVSQNDCRRGKLATRADPDWSVHNEVGADFSRRIDGGQRTDDGCRVYGHGIPFNEFLDPPVPSGNPVQPASAAARPHCGMVLSLESA